MRTQCLALATTAFGLLLGGGGMAWAGRIDMQRAAAGAEPFSDLLLDTEPAWSVLLRPGLTANAADRPGELMLAERGLGNNIWTDLGQVQQYLPIDDRLRRLIWDLLAEQPIPLIFYLDPDRSGTSEEVGPSPPAAVVYPVAGSALRGNPAVRDRPDAASTPQVIPEPSSLLMALGGMVVASRRKSRRGGGR